tara:strand:- start:263 stop:757 length:495 start_codon:yes stop_codon:yes gene_type:complete
MADNLKAKRILGGKYTPDDVLELKFTYTGDAHSCVQWIEVIDGATVTHGGNSPAATKLHYKAHLRDDGSTDEDERGIIDYTTSHMTIVQTEKGTTVVRVCADILLKSTHDTFMTNYNTWYANYHKEGGEEGELVEGAPNAPAFPEPTTHKSGEITLEWTDDAYV